MHTVWKLALLLKKQDRHEHIAFIAEQIIAYLKFHRMEYSNVAKGMIQEVLSTLFTYGLNMNPSLRKYLPSMCFKIE